MNRNSSTPRPMAARRATPRSGSVPKAPVPALSEMTYLLLITVAAALMIGILALPLTMSNVVVSAAHPAFGAPDAGAATARAAPVL